ncbi:chy zinc finger domain-containing protein [Neofusicoccum parvum]|nr:chy zinc finger domain-containing protein [Neofusicoccum parvum]
MSESLPADDGMRLLRLRIHEIRKLSVSNDEKARRMHFLMTERYNALQGHITRPRSPASIMSQDRPFTPSSTLSDMHISSPNSVYSAFDSDNPYNLTVEDLKPTFYPVSEHAHEHGEGAHMDEDEHEDEQTICGCQHYRRNVKIQCFDCNRWHTRGEGLGKDFIHCKKCNVCISIKFAEDHRCIERATDADCPICKDYMFTSSTDVVSMKCGHYMHRDCYDSYMQTDYKCPMCKKSAVNMELQWRKLRDAIDSQPMPAQFADTKLVIHCNDCSVKSTSNYHWLGNQCAHCESFNTNELRLLVGNETDQDLGVGTPTDPTAVPSSPRSCLAPAPNIIERRSSGSYFLLAEREEREAREREAAMRPSSADGSTFSPFEMLQRVRSLSPVRRFLRGSDDEMEDAAYDDEEEDSDDSMDEDEDQDDEELDDAADDILSGIDLIGHR